MSLPDRQINGSVDDRILYLNMNNTATSTPNNFLEEIIEADLAAGRYASILTRFPPEPNGYLHVGHATSICLNFGLAQRYGGAYNLRFDDTNPVTEETEYVDSIIADVRWLGFEPANILYESDYFQQLYEWAKVLIMNGKAYVDFSTAEEIAALKGTPTEPGKDSPYRNTPPEENLALFEKMKDGEFIALKEDFRKQLESLRSLSQGNKIYHLSAKVLRDLACTLN